MKINKCVKKKKRQSDFVDMLCRNSFNLHTANWLFFKNQFYLPAKSFHPKSFITQTHCHTMKRNHNTLTINPSPQTVTRHTKKVIKTLMWTSFSNRRSVKHFIGGETWKYFMVQFSCFKWTK